MKSLGGPAAFPLLLLFLFSCLKKTFCYVFPWFLFISSTFLGSLLLVMMIWYFRAALRSLACSRFLRDRLFTSVAYDLLSLCRVFLLCVCRWRSRRNCLPSCILRCILSSYSRCRGSGASLPYKS